MDDNGMEQKIERTSALASKVREAVLRAVGKAIKGGEGAVDEEGHPGFDDMDHQAILVGIGAAIGDMASASMTIARPLGTRDEMQKTIIVAFEAALGWADERVKSHFKEQNEKAAS